ncbi:universal stress protein [Ferrimonas sediminicola]|uniref:Universal stress protein n=1 Tax=Ferrimonas sediminicola TaxID=2569538 RepID=A0A4U1B7E5_9GAMM|nr:universal stress protein [Ferrimonas sediminicola]TKB46504.1 universal stress protein [Ferrimonas sediminicola]
MSFYKKVLVPLDFHDDNERIVAKGKKLADDNNAELFLLHVDESMSDLYLFEAASFSGHLKEFKQDICRRSQEKLAKMGAGLDDNHLLVREGRAPGEIEKVVKELGIDLIVMGSHGHSGLRRLLGSTVNVVLNHVQCDVLTVRTQDA